MHYSKLWAPLASYVDQITLVGTRKVEPFEFKDEEGLTYIIEVIDVPVLDTEDTEDMYKDMLSITRIIGEDELAQGLLCNLDGSIDCCFIGSNRLELNSFVEVTSNDISSLEEAE